MGVYFLLCTKPGGSQFLGASIEFERIWVVGIEIEKSVTVGSPGPIPPLQPTHPPTPRSSLITNR